MVVGGTVSQPAGTGNQREWPLPRSNRNWQPGDHGRPRGLPFRSWQPWHGRGFGCVADGLVYWRKNAMKLQEKPSSCHQQINEYRRVIIRTPHAWPQPPFWPESRIVINHPPFGVARPLHMFFFCSRVYTKGFCRSQKPE